MRNAVLSRRTQVSAAALPGVVWHRHGVPEAGAIFERRVRTQTKTPANLNIAPARTMTLLLQVPLPPRA
jgi:hypothetical protein